jgi:hypothetical protein
MIRYPKVILNRKPSTFQVGSFSLVNISLLAILFLYLPIILKEQIFSDEYDLLGDGSALAEHIREDGRPVGAIVYKFMAFIVDDPADLTILRVISLCSALILLKLLSREFLKIESNTYVQIILISSLFLPSFVLFITWAMLSYFMISTTLSFIAFGLWESKKLSLRVIALFLQILVLLIYPPAGFTAFALYGSILAISNDTLQQGIKRIVDWMIFSLIAGTVAVSAVIVDSKQNGTSLNERVNFVSAADLTEKIAWLFSRPLLISTRFFDIRSPSSASAALGFLLFTIVILVGFRHKFKSWLLAFQRIVLFLISLLLSITPIAISVDNQFDYRLILGPSVAAYTIFLYLLINLIHRRNPRNYISFYVLIIALFLGIFSMYSHSMKLFIEPYYSKKEIITEALNSCFSRSGQPSRIMLIQSENKFDQRMNLGLYSMKTDLASEWVPKPSFELALLELRLPTVPVDFQPPGSEVNSLDCRIDMEMFVARFKN